MTSAADKARNARIRTKEVGSAARDTARNNASAAGVKLTPREERLAADRMRPTISAERERTAGRATSAVKREAAKASEKRIAAATGNAQSKTAPKPKVLKAGPTLSGEVFTPGSLVRGVAKVVGKVVGKKAVRTALDKAAGKSVVSAAKGITKQSAKEKAIIAKLDKAHPKAQAKAQKIIDKAVKKNPNLFK